MDKVHSEASVEQTATYDLGVIVIVGLVGHEDTLGRARLACDASAYLGRFSEGQIRPVRLNVSSNSSHGWNFVVSWLAWPLSAGCPAMRKIAERGAS